MDPTSAQELYEDDGESFAIDIYPDGNCILSCGGEDFGTVIVPIAELPRIGRILIALGSDVPTTGETGK